MLPFGNALGSPISNCVVHGRRLDTEDRTGTGGS